MAREALVQTFGGTSVATAECRAQVVRHLRAAHEGGYRVAIVGSARRRRGDPYATDTRLDLMRCDGSPWDPADYNMIVVTGEMIAAGAMSHTPKPAGIPSAPLSGARARLFAGGAPLEADEASIPQLVALPSLEMRLLPAASVDDARLAGWERQRVVMSIEDTATGRLAVGDEAGGATVLDRGLSEAAIGSAESRPTSCWASVVAPGAFRHVRDPLRSALTESRAQAHLEGHMPGRSTFIGSVPDLAKAVASLRAACLEGKPPCPHTPGSTTGTSSQTGGQA